MLFDTDILIFVQRGNIKAAKLIEKTSERKISILTYMELLQGAKNKKQHKYTIDFLKTFNFEILPLTENIGHRAAVYVEEYSLSHYVRSGDAIIAATAVENGLSLSTANVKHFKHIKELDLVIFKP
ncbi:MAG: PIN domain-containing protein [Candidatus Aminicenantes bacterium]|nr:PIN domain-containing protein [Candidatus Aminicenantes bacterium]NIM81070.1 PIN domain-containing protein [Candidatus Aminicenantes bacterium]NIN20447.1 PIN domain-containing protein [Candidatus Aminicenantes bacterium]NIN44220.1 PIN domain-containing protein [Candidatus Aminicenantes bacterium]NIN87038.1 PIN domain-containing protein [Candidatus Aminicenantes bacterium]